MDDNISVFALPVVPSEIPLKAVNPQGEVASPIRNFTRIFLNLWRIDELIRQISQKDTVDSGIGKVMPNWGTKINTTSRN
jgi:hypothetical protein